MELNCTTYVYTIDNEDKIVSVCDNWLSFAEENQAADALHPQLIENKSIWAFIEGYEATQLYSNILKNIREHNKSITLPFRCDSPDKRRYLKLVISPTLHDNIEFVSHLIREEDRDSVDILRVDVSRSSGFITMCCMCNKVRLENDLWVEVETAIVTLKLFELNELPKISHGLCKECFAISMAEIENINKPNITPVLYASSIPWSLS